jgi:WD40 repeat protein
VEEVAWSPDSRRIATSGAYDGMVQVWDAATGQVFATYPGHDDWVEAVTWSPDGRCIASGARDKTVQV